MAKEHTPLPWSCSENLERDHRVWIYGTVGPNKPRIAVAEWGVDMGQDMVATAKANAEFIVRAVNSFDKLVEALKVILAYDAVNTVLPQYYVDKTREALAICRDQAMSEQNEFLDLWTFWFGLQEAYGAWRAGMPRDGVEDRATPHGYLRDDNGDYFAFHVSGPKP